MQAGVAAGPPGAGCWMVDLVRRVDDRDGGDDVSCGSGPNGGGGEAVVPCAAERSTGVRVLV